MPNELLIFLSRRSMPYVVVGIDGVQKVRELVEQGLVVGHAPLPHEEGVATVHSLTDIGRAEVLRTYLDSKSAN